MTRICVDLDNVKYIDALRVAFNMKYVLGGYTTIDKTSKGYHVCCFTDKELTPEQNIWLRETFGDDPWRVDISRRRLKIHKKAPYDIIFRWKDGREVIKEVMKA